MVEYNMTDAIVAKAPHHRRFLGPRLQALQTENPGRQHTALAYIDRIYDTYIDEEELQNVDGTIMRSTNSEPRPYTSREFIMSSASGSQRQRQKKDSLIQRAYEKGVPIFVPAFSDCSAGFGIVKHQVERRKAGKPYLTIDSGGDFRELPEIKLAAGTTALFMVGGGVPKNFAQDTVVCAEILGHHDVEVHKYAVQITVADVRDGACSSSTLQEAASWGKVSTVHEQMVFAEATSVAPIIVSDAYHRGGWKTRSPQLGKAVRVRGAQRRNTRPPLSERPFRRQPTLIYRAAATFMKRYKGETHANTDYICNCAATRSSAGLLPASGVAASRRERRNCSGSAGRVHTRAH